MIAAGFWLVAVLAVMGSLMAYSSSPGNPAIPPQRWPAQSQIPLDSSRPTLVMVVHPRCPCSRASVGELELLVARCQGQFSAHVLFTSPAGTPEDWAKTDLWRKVSSIPGVNVLYDKAGIEARHFRLETSGHTVLYGRDGQLMFQGGITLSRGHAGDNPGRDALSALLRHEPSTRSQTPVFGCSLFGAERQQGNVLCKQ